MEDNKKEEILEKVEELSKSDDTKNAYYEIKKFGRFFKDNDDASLYDQELNDKFEKYLNDAAKKLGDIKGDIKEKKEEIIAAAKAALDSNEFKNASKKMKDLMDEWKQAGHLDKETDDNLWVEFSNIRDEFYKKKNEYYEKLVEKFDANKNQKLDIIEKAEEALKNVDVPAANKVMKDLMDAWKKVGSAGKDAEEELWSKFKGLRNDFFERRDAYNESMKKVYAERVEKKQEIINKAKILLARSEFSDEEIKEMDDLKNTWKEIGSAGRDNENSLWDAFSAILNKYNDNKKFYK